MSFDYSDIAKYAISLVTDHVDVKNELKYYYNEILVDEYQDTSDIQEAFLSAIENNNLYILFNNTMKVAADAVFMTSKYVLQLFSLLHNNTFRKEKKQK